LPELNCPRIKENHQDIKSQKDKSIEIIMEIKLYPGLADGLHAAFKDGAFYGIGVTGDNFEKSEDNGDNYHKKGEEDGGD
jgi:hypothetical protein